MKRSRWMVAGMLLTVAWATASWAQHIVIYGFEGTLQGWAIPDWAKGSSDYVAEECAVSDAHATEGQHGLEIRVSFPGGHWTGAYVEHETEVTDWTSFSRLAVDAYVPQDAPRGLGGRLILTVGEQWQWTEMNRAIPLEPGRWTTITVNLKPGSMDWKFFPSDAFRQSVRKIGVRVESDKQPVYTGSVFLDNIRLEE